jgi:hypothetical protein
LYNFTLNFGWHRKAREKLPFSREKIRSQWTSWALIPNIDAHRGITANDGTKPIYRNRLKDFIHLDPADFPKIARNWSLNKLLEILPRQRDIISNREQIDRNTIPIS